MRKCCSHSIHSLSSSNSVNQRLDELNYLAVSANTFVGLCRTYPVILKPLRNIQQTLRNYFNITKDFWDRQSKNRQMMADSE